MGTDASRIGATGRPRRRVAAHRHGVRVVAQSYRLRGRTGPGLGDVGAAGAQRAVERAVKRQIRALAGVVVRQCQSQRKRLIGESVRRGSRGRAEGPQARSDNVRRIDSVVDRLVGHADAARATAVRGNRNWIARPAIGPGDEIGPNRGPRQHQHSEGGDEKSRTFHVRGSFPIRSTVHESQKHRLHLHRSGIAGEKGNLGIAGKPFSTQGELSPCPNRATKRGHPNPPEKPCQ